MLTLYSKKSFRKKNTFEFSLPSFRRFSDKLKIIHCENAVKILGKSCKIL